jgi:molybdenum storage protein
VKDVDGLYDSDPNENPDATFIPKIGARELQQRNIKSLPFDRILLDLLHNTRLVKQFQVVNGHKPETIAAAVRGEHVGSIIHADN